MIKKILFLFLFFVIISCGKKGDPVFKETKNKLNKQDIYLNKV
tara:strand:- start:1280 stop:1408 length:129 start_codon:yes stop_codon:yes gene_type:complete